MGGQINSGDKLSRETDLDILYKEGYCILNDTIEGMREEETRWIDVNLRENSMKVIIE